MLHLREHFAPQHFILLSKYDPHSCHGLLWLSDFLLAYTGNRLTDRSFRWQEKGWFGLALWIYDSRILQGQWQDHVFWIIIYLEIIFEIWYAIFTLQQYTWKLNQWVKLFPVRAWLFCQLHCMVFWHYNYHCTFPFPLLFS